MSMIFRAAGGIACAAGLAVAHFTGGLVPMGAIAAANTTRPHPAAPSPGRVAPRAAAAPLDTAPGPDTARSHVITRSRAVASFPDMAPAIDVAPAIDTTSSHAAASSHGVASSLAMAATGAGVIPAPSTRDAAEADSETFVLATKSTTGPDGYSPGFVSFSFGMLIFDDTVRHDFGGVSNRYNTQNEDSRSYDVQAGWNINSDAHGNSYFMVGAFSLLNDIESMVDSRGVRSAGHGSYRNRGFYVGVGTEWVVPSGATSSFLSFVEPTLGTNIGLGYGWNRVRFSSAGFNPNDSGVITRAEAYMKLRVSKNLYMAPSVTLMLGPDQQVHQGLLSYATLRTFYQF